MRQLILFSAFLLTCGTVFSQTTPVTGNTVVPDSPKQVQPVDPKPSIDTNKSKAADEVAKTNTDSITLMNDLKFQQKNPGTLYENVAKNKWPSILIGLLLVAGLGFWLLSSTSLCRDQSYNPETNQLRPLKERPFSYAKIQLFWWSVIVLSSFTIFYFYTNRLAAFTPTMVLLLGGGLAVSMFGKVIDNTQIQQDDEGVPSRHQDTQPSQGLFVDILSDDNGISIHRFQSIIINLVFGIAFLASFFQLVTAHKFPFIEFETWQLTLLGISSGAYLGFKTNENHEATKEKRQAEAVKVASKRTAAKTMVVTGTVGAMDANVTTAEADAPDEPPTTVAYQRLKSKLIQKGMVNE